MMARSPTPDASWTAGLASGETDTTVGGTDQFGAKFCPKSFWNGTKSTERWRDPLPIPDIHEPRAYGIVRAT